jgi:hypothetical protein
MTKLQLVILLVAVVVVAGVVLLLVSDREPVLEVGSTDVIEEEVGPGVQTVELAFADRTASRIVTEEREIVVPDDRPGRARRILEELARGPEKRGVATIPPGTRVISVVFDDAGGAYVDFSRELQDNHPGGSAGEIFTIRSIIATLAGNFPEVRSVKFLIEGREIETIAGHYDASEAFPVESYR